jgi:hypothetical protein
MPLTTQIYSTHLFLLPFQWDIITPQNSLSVASYDDRTRLLPTENGSYFHQLLLSNKSWKRHPFSTSQSHLDYNQYHYFYDFVRGAIFDNDKSASNTILRTYYYDKGQLLRYKIKIKDGDSSKEYDLKIDSIQLNAYEVGVGILSFHLSSDETTYKKTEN